LDESRVQHLLELLIQKKEFGQVFITDTHENRVTEIIEKFEVNFGKFIVRNGEIEEIEMKD